MSQTLVDIARHKIEPLSSTNYSIWSKKIQLLLRVKGLWKIVSGKEQPPTASDTDAFYLYTQRRDVAITDIILSIEDRCSHAVINFDDPYLVWMKLEEMYKVVFDACIDTYLERLQSINMEYNEKVMEYVNRLAKIENDLAGVGHLLDDKDKMKALLRSLREEFSMTAKVIRAMKMTFTKGVSEVVIEEGSHLTNRITNSTNTETALTAFYQNGRPICSHCGRMDHIPEQSFHNPRSKPYIREFKRRNKV